MSIGLSKPSPALIAEYKKEVAQRLEGLEGEGLTVDSCLNTIPSLEAYLRAILDRWYKIYTEKLNSSVFEKTSIQFGTMTMRCWNKHEQEAEFGTDDYHSHDLVLRMARDYEEIIKAIQRHCEMLDKMPSSDFPGQNPTRRR